MIQGLALSPRQSRLVLNLFTGAVILSVAFALAGLTWRMLGHAGTGAITVPAARAPAQGAGTGPATALSPFGKVAVSDASQPTSLPLVLQGIVAANPESLSTAFIAVSGQPAQPFKVGENVGGATIQAIRRDRVILSNGGRSEYLGFPDPTQQPPPADAGAPAPAAAPAPATKAAPPPDPAQAIAPLAQQLGATRTDAGYRINSAAIPGLQPGDVVLSVNGTPLSDPTAAGAAFQAAKGAGSATIVVARGGNQMTITIPLR